MSKPFNFRMASLVVCLILLSGCGQENSSMSAHAATTQSDHDQVTAQTDYAEIVILSHPKSLSVTETDPFSLNVIAFSKAPLRYQWYKNDQPISGAIYASYSKTKSTTKDQAIYRVVIATEHAKHTSISANVNVTPKAIPLKIVTPPKSQTIPAGSPLLLNVKVEGEGPFSYRWQKNGSLISGATSADYQVAQSQKSDEGTYRVIISNQSTKVYSDFVVIKVAEVIQPHPDIVITSQPKSLSITETDSFSLNVEASSEAPLRYQWYKNNQAISGAVYSSYSRTTSALNDQGSYHVVITNEHTQIKSLFVNININPKAKPLKIVQAPQGQSVSAGDSFSLAVAAEGEGSLSYRWQKDGSLIPNATNPYYLVSKSQKSDQGSYRVIISNGSSTVYSSFVNVWVTDAIEPLSISAQPVSQIISENSSAKLSVSANGGGFITYHWRKNGLPIANAYSPTLTLFNVSKADQGAYDVVIANSQGRLVSSAAYLEVLSTEAPVMISQQPLSQNIQLGDSFALNVGTLTDTPVQIQWFLNGEAIPGADSAIYWVEKASYSHLGSYSVLVSNELSEVRSEPASITLYQPETYAIELSWETPRIREDGSPLDADEIQGYVIEYGYEPEQLNKRVEISQQIVNSHILDDIHEGTVFLRIATVDTNSYRGSFSETISLSVD